MLLVKMCTKQAIEFQQIQDMQQIEKILSNQKDFLNMWNDLSIQQHGTFKSCYAVIYSAIYLNNGY